MSELTVPTAPALDLPAHDTSTTGLVLDGRNMDSMMRAAEMMSQGRATVPKHLQGSPSDCMAVIMQAMQWNMNPFVVAQKTHVVNGTLGYEAQLVNAVVQASGAIEGRFHYDYQGTGNGLECRVGATIAGEQAITWNEWLKISDVTTKNSPLWKTNPKQQMGYLQLKNWARAYTPGALLGVYTVDELQDAPPMRDITPRNGTEYGEAAKAQPTVDDDAIQNLIIDLEILAKENGADAFKSAWNSLTPDQRKAIGIGERNRMAALANVEDAQVVQNTTSEQAQAEAGKPAQGAAAAAPTAQQDGEGNPFDGVHE